MSLRKFRWIVINSSGGKDSVAALVAMMQMAHAQGIPRDRFVVSHQDLGDMEWPGVKELVQKQADVFGLRTEFSKYRNKEGQELTLLDYVRKRGKWPSSKQRYCTSDFKRGPGSRIITKLRREDPGHILQVFGFRSDESPSRKRKEVMTQNKRISTKRWEVWDYLPIHRMTEEDVYNTCKQYQMPMHPAYELGMPRLSCCFCIFAPKAALMVAGKHNPELLDDYVEVEQEIGHTFRQDLTLESVRDDLRAGVEAGRVNNWKM